MARRVWISRSKSGNIRKFERHAHSVMRDVLETMQIQGGGWDVIRRVQAPSTNVQGIQRTMGKITGDFKAACRLVREEAHD